MMKYKLITILIIILISSCVSRKEKNTQEIKIEYIQELVNKIGFIELPLVFDANNENALKSIHFINMKGKDSLLFDNTVERIIGFLPDTSKYYAIMFYEVGDMLYPSIMTIDKTGNKIGREIICAAGCAGHAVVEISSCYDSVWIQKNLKIKSISKVIGIVETEDSIPQTIKICNKTIVEGLINENGLIKINRSELIDCTDE